MAILYYPVELFCISPFPLLTPLFFCLSVVRRDRFLRILQTAFDDAREEKTQHNTHTHKKGEKKRKLTILNGWRVYKMRERERDPLYTRLSERNNKRLRLFIILFAGDGETNADYCLSPSSAPGSERYFSRGDIYDRRHIWTRCGERILYPGEQQQHV